MIPLSVMAVLAAVAMAQDAGRNDRGPAQREPAPKNYVVHLTEFRLGSSADPRLTADDILRSFDQANEEGTIDLIGTVRVHALGGHESRVQFGTRKAMTMGTSVSNRGAQTRSFQMQELGTIVQVTATPYQEKVLLRLSYESSRVEGEEQDDGPPEIRLVQIDTTLLIRPGAPSLIGGTSAHGTQYLRVSIENERNGQ
ncbi:MAG: hypothetical protein ACYTGC_14635 [Planctomycetota bacterium]